VFTTPWISVSVTMSPFATWLISWPSTASTSSRFMPRRSPSLTATSAASRRAPVAKALGEADGKIATWGIAMPAACA
jgi:purine-cytosine permease-like protein